MGGSTVRWTLMNTEPKGGKCDSNKLHFLCTPTTQPSQLVVHTYGNSVQPLVASFLTLPSELGVGRVLKIKKCLHVRVEVIEVVLRYPLPERVYSFGVCSTKFSRILSYASLFDTVTHSPPGRTLTCSYFLRARKFMFCSSEYSLI